MVFVGVHPVLTQVPPSSPFSFSATRPPKSASRRDNGLPAWPEPITIASYFMGGRSTSVRSVRKTCSGGATSLFNHEQQVFRIDFVAHVRKLLRDFTVYRGVNSRLHFHCLEYEEPVAFFPLLSRIDGDDGNGAGNRRTHLPRLRRVGFGPRVHGGAQSSVPHRNFPRL